ncbi:uroporphyrinogen-III synthase [Ancylobacter amanitiformis]|uniref:Uroporphyrinogen-III synthase n=1 Tax=Ancylobacter amanitiformis TaxID=217069 RepID=A0ABU0LP50_9HYPH|nr:uroporphyrinogen-III synthase [Ancylobacter amanitiformis]MDQ0510449.1 uroporphyrinogen-III synthase [Ancylobacter amanitiformis]
MRVLVTRPQPDAQATADRLAAAGHAALLDPLLLVETLADARLPAGAFDAVALTSVNGARLLGLRPELAALAALPLYAVGRRTAAAAPAAFGTVHIAGGDGLALAGLLRGRLAPGMRVLHVAGEDRAVDLSAALAPAGIGVDLFVIYRAVAAPRLGATTMAAAREGRIDRAFHFSPRTAATLVARAGEAGLMGPFAQVTHLCFSAKVAAPLVAVGWPTRIAAAPTEEGLFALLDG